MKKSLDYCVAPVIRERGFQGEFPIFRRIRGEQLDIVELQFDKWGGGFRWNLAVFLSEGLTHYGKHVPPEELRVGYPAIRKYFLDPRNVTGGKAKEHWFAFTENNTDEVARSMLPYVELADRWFLTSQAPHAAPGKPRRESKFHKFLVQIFGRPYKG